LDEPCSPLAHHLRCDALARRNHLVVLPIGAGQHDARSQRQGLRRLASQRQRLELLTLGFSQNQCRFRSSAHDSLVLYLRYMRDLEAQK
jgi:hypothetical protein